MFERPTTSSSSSPEELLDHWLDALNEPSGSTTPAPPPEIEEIATIARHYRQALGVPIAANSLVAERNGSMNHSLPLTTKAHAWQTVHPPRQRRPSTAGGWLNRVTNGLATAMVIALLVALGGAMILQQTGLPGGPGNPTALPGIGGQPGATPEGGALDCASPGYRPVVEGDADEQALAAIGLTGQPVVIGEDNVTVPRANGDEITTPKGNYVSFDPGAMVTHFEDGSSTVIRLADGESWDFPAVENPILDRTVAGNGRYYVAPTDGTGTDWHVLDTHTGERTTTADILGEPFEGPLWPMPGQHQSSNDGSVFVINFGQSITGAVTTESSGLDPGALVIPGSVIDAYFGFLSPYTTVSPDGAFLASYNEVLYAETGDHVVGESFSGFISGTFIGFADDEPTVLALVDGEVRSIQPLNGTENVVASADEDIQAVAYDEAADTIVVGAGMTESETWAWIDLETSETRPLPELSGYQLSMTSIVAPTSLVDGVAQFTQPTENGPWTIRGLDMESGGISGPITHHVAMVREWAVLSPASVRGGYITAQDASGGFTIVSPGSGAAVELGAPAGVDLFDGSIWSLSISPNGACAVLGNYVVRGDLIEEDTTYIAPIEPGATWTKLDFSITQWLEVPNDLDTETLPAQKIASPAATPTD